MKSAQPVPAKVPHKAPTGIAGFDWITGGGLCMAPSRNITGSAETYLVRTKTLAKKHGARCLVIAPVSTWSKSGNDLAAHSVACRSSSRAVRRFQTRSAS